MTTVFLDALLQHLVESWFYQGTVFYSLQTIKMQKQHSYVTPTLASKEPES